MVLAAESYWSHRALEVVVVQRHARVVEEPRESSPPLEHVLHRLAQRTALRQPELACPREDRSRDRARLLVAQGGTTREVAGLFLGRHVRAELKDERPQERAC